MKKRILCIDDDHEVLELFTKYLEGKGFQVIGLERATHCLEEIVDKSPQLVILDVSIPEIDGLTMLELIRKMRIAITLPIIVVSSDGGSDTIVRAIKLGADDYIVKPFSLSHLFSRIESQLFDVDFTTLKRVLSELDPEPVGKALASAFPGLPCDFDRWVHHVIHFDNKELHAFIVKELRWRDIANMNENSAMKQVLIVQKTNLRWKPVWPHFDLYHRLRKVCP